jgi:hypothetical protein
MLLPKLRIYPNVVSTGTAGAVIDWTRQSPLQVWGTLLAIDTLLLCSMGTTHCRMIAEAPDQSELPFMCLQYGLEEAAKHPVPDGKFVKVACVHKSVPRIIN